MSTGQHEIAAFLRARITDHRALAQACLAEVGDTRTGDPYPDGSGFAERDDFPSYPWGVGEAELAYLQRQHPKDVIADCDAKLALINLFEQTSATGPGDSVTNAFLDGWKEALEEALKVLTQPYAGHPDYRSGWTP